MNLPEWLTIPVKEKIREIIDDEVLRVEDLNIIKASNAMLEAGIKEEKIKELLIKHWNLRPSEAMNFLRKANRLIK